MSFQNLYLTLLITLIAKIDEQIQLAANKDYTPTQHKWVTDEHGNQRKVEVAKRVKRWWTASVDGKINLVVRYRSTFFVLQCVTSDCVNY